METLIRWDHRGIRLGVSLWICFATPIAIQAQTASPSRLRAAYIYNFSKFVEWPTPPSSQAPKSFVLCAYGKGPVNDALQHDVAGRMVEGKVITVKTVSDPGQVQACQVLYVGPAAGEHLPHLLTNLHGVPVLTIGETADFAAAGGMIGFEVESNQLRFVINVRAAKAAGLKVSSRLLSLATKVQQ
jgi:hypothetical protein